MSMLRYVMAVCFVANIAACGRTSTEEPVDDPAPAPTANVPVGRDWRPLYDGATIDGWVTIGSGSWTVEDSILVGRHEANDPRFGHLVSDSVYDDFLLRARFKIVRGNSGLYFRSVVDDEGDISGLQVEMSETFGTGGLWETNGRGWVAMPTSQEVSTWFKPGVWNEVIVKALNLNVDVWMNGIHSATFRDDDPRFAGWQEGRVAIQLHAGEDVEIHFAAIEIAPAN